MAETTQDRTEPATPRRREEAHERGQVARSSDLSAAAILLGGTVLLGWTGPEMVRVLADYAAYQMGASNRSAWFEMDLRTDVLRVAMVAGSAAGPMLAALLLIAVVVNVAQVGFLMTGHPLQPTLDRLNPLRGFGRLFSARTAVQLVMNLAKLALVCWIAWIVVREQVPAILGAIEVGGRSHFMLFGRLTFDFALRLGVALLILGILDYLWQRYQHERDLRMTKEEVKEELRRMEGDPIVRQRRRQLQLQIAMQRLRYDVPKADVVVTNPTELAIAIRYDAATMPAPRVVAKGQGYMAERIRAIAIEFGVPIIERKPLAQALFKSVEVGQEIPASFYAAVAEVLAYVYALSREGIRRRPAPVTAR